jgi:hypothetical protein
MEGKIRADWVSTRVMGSPEQTYANAFSLHRIDDRGVKARRRQNSRPPS